MEEKILCAAVWYKEIELKKDMPIGTYLPKNLDKGIVFCGLRHEQCIYSKCGITGLRDAESGENEQGFLTSKNRFVSREEGLQIGSNGEWSTESKSGYGRCKLSYEAHTADKVCLLSLTKHLTRVEAQKELEFLVNELGDNFVDGFAFVETEEKFRVGE